MRSLSKVPKWLFVTLAVAVFAWTVWPTPYTYHRTCINLAVPPAARAPDPIVAPNGMVISMPRKINAWAVFDDDPAEFSSLVEAVSREGPGWYTVKYRSSRLTGRPEWTSIQPAMIVSLGPNSFDDAVLPDPRQPDKPRRW